MSRLALALALALLLSYPHAVSAQIRQSVETAGPIALGETPDRIVMIAATYEELVQSRPGGWTRTLERLRFRDQTGRLLYQETFPTRVIIGQGFEEEVALGAPLEVRGTGRRFLLIPQEFLPSAPSSGKRYLVYGFDRSGRFKRLGAPIEGSGQVIRNPTGPRRDLMHLREGRYLDVSRWTGSFTLILPIRVQGSAGRAPRGGPVRQGRGGRSASARWRGGAPRGTGAGLPVQDRPRHSRVEGRVPGRLPGPEPRPTRRVHRVDQGAAGR